MSSAEHMLYRMAYRMAMADGEMSPNEALMLHLFEDELGLSRADIQSLKQESKQVDFEDLPREFPKREDQLRLFETVCLMAMIDGRSEVEELYLVLRLCEVLGIERPLAQQCLGNARERLNQLASVHNLLPEIQRNMQESAGGDPDKGGGSDA